MKIKIQKGKDEMMKEWKFIFIQRNNTIKRRTPVFQMFKSRLQVLFRLLFLIFHRGEGQSLHIKLFYFFLFNPFFIIDL